MRKVMRNKKHILGIVGACLFALFIVLLLPGTATAAQNVENTYAVVVTTGNEAGDDVSYFALEYVDTDGYTHMEYVFPFKGGLQDALKMASLDGAYSYENPLGRGKTNTYFFQPEYEVAQINGLDIYCQGEQGKLHSWDVSGLRLYRVDQIIDVVSNGNNNLIRFNGSQIAYLEERSGTGGVVFSWTGNTLFQLRQERSSSYQLVFESVPYSMEGDFKYAVRLDFADFSDAGFEQMNQAYNADKPLRDANFGEYLAIQIEYMDSFGDLRSVTQPVMTSAVNWLLENGVSGDTKIAGLAQQGETIVFGCTLQDMHKIQGITLHTGWEAQALLNQTVAGSESASVTGISIYPGSSVSVSESTVENSASAPEYFFAGNPLFYHAATTVEGETVPADGTLYVSMNSYEAGVALSPVDATEKYLIQLIADPSQITRLPDDVTVELRYVDMSGAPRESGAYSVRNGAKDFYGYWPASREDFAFASLINSESGISFVMELSQVEHFTGLSISVPDGSSDWQMAGFRVIRLDRLGKRACVWEDTVVDGATSNRRYYRDVEGYTVFSMEEKALIQPNNGAVIDFISQSVQKVDDFDWSQFRYAMSYDQCSSNLGLAKARENYTVEVQVQSGTTSLLDSYGDNGSKNRFYFLLEFENGVSGYVLANQQLSADGFRSGSTESFTVSTNYDYGELVSVHIIPDDISEDSDPYDKLNIAQIRVRRNDGGSISKEWVVQNVGWIGIDYRDEGAGSSISGQQGRKETEIARVYPISYSSYALNMEFCLGTGAYTDSGSGGPFYGTMEATLEYYSHEGKRKQLTFDVIRAMYDYANKAPIYLDNGTTGSTGTPLAVSDNSFMFRENHTDRFVISVSEVAKLGKLSLNMKSLNGGSLQITNVSAGLVMSSGLLQINEQDEYVRLGKTEFLCEDAVDKIPAFELFLPTDRNIYQEIYFGEHEAIKLDTKTNTWISAVSRLPSSQNDVMNVFVYLADDASGTFDIDVRAQYTNSHGVVLETGAKGLEKVTDAEGKTIYSVSGLTATGMSALNRVYVKAQSADLADAYIDHVIVQQVRSGVVINTFYLDCEHRNAEMEFYALPSKAEGAQTDEQTVCLLLGEETEPANLVAENRDIAIALQYTTISGGSQTFTSRYIYVTDQQYQAIKSGDILELTFHEGYVKDITGILVATSGNVKLHVDMACADTYLVDATAGTRQAQKHFAIPVGATVQNQTLTLPVSGDTSVEILDIQFDTALSGTQLESGTNDPIIMVLGYTDRRGAQKELVVPDLREHVVSEGAAFSTGSTTQVRLMMRDIASVHTLQLMPYNINPKIAAVWKPSQMILSLGTEGSVQKVTRSLDSYIYEDKELNFDQEITGEMIGGLKINLSNIILSADVSATNELGYYGNVYRVNSVSNKALSMTVSSEAIVKFNVSLSNSAQGYTVAVEQTDGLTDISESIFNTEEGFVLFMPENITGMDQSYRVTVRSRENETIVVEITLTVKSEDLPEPSTETTEPSTETTDPSAETTEPPAETRDPSVETTEPPTETTDPSAETTEPSAETTDPSAETTVPPTETTNPSEETTEPPTETTEASTDPTQPPEETSEPTV